jgi:sugar phosphate permease
MNMMNQQIELNEVTRRKTIRYRMWIFLVIALAYFFVYFNRVSPSVMATELTKAFQTSSSGLGLFSSMYLWAYAAAQLPSGIMADRLGIRKTISFFLMVAGFGTLLFGFANSFSFAMFSRFLVGFGVGFVYVPAMRFLGDWFCSAEFAFLFRHTDGHRQHGCAGRFRAAENHDEFYGLEHEHEDRGHRNHRLRIPLSVGHPQPSP